MNATQILILLYGRDAHLLETRKWVLQSLGYRVQTMHRLADIHQIPQTPPVALLVLCHTLSAKECADAIDRATALWPQLKKLALLRDTSRRPSDVLGQVQQTLDGPAPLLRMVGELVGYAGSSSCSHTY
jgi:hypothetical protein